MVDLAETLGGRLGASLRVAMRVKTFIVIVTAMVMAFTFLFVVVFRYLLQTDLFAYEEWLLINCFWLFFIASAMGTYDQTHISADLLSYVLKTPRALWWRAIIIGIIELVVTLAIVYWGILMIADEINSYPFWQRTIALQIPFIVPRLAILTGFVLMSIYSALHLYALVKLGAEGAFGKNNLNNKATL